MVDSASKAGLHVLVNPASRSCGGIYKRSSLPRSLPHEALRRTVRREPVHGLLSLRGEGAGSDQGVKVALHLRGHVTSATEHAELDVLVVSGAGHVGAGEQDVAAIDDHSLGVELGVRWVAVVDG